MTKDRRLGRGLAALLGSPLEEDQVLEGTALQANSNSLANSSAGNRSTAATSRGVASGSANPMSRASASAPPAAADSAEPASASRSNTAREGRSVTGSVPLHPEPRPTSKPTGSAAKSAQGALELNVHEIDNNPFQPRRKFNQEEIASLAESIREHEQLQPILVRCVGDRYQLISGERRLRATIHAGFQTIRAEVREADDRLVAELAIVENLQRKDLDAIEKAMSFRRYIDEHQCRQDDLAKRLKIDRSTIANLMRLLELPAQIQQWVQDDKLTAGHARTLLPLGNDAQQLSFAKLIMEEGWTVRDTERRVNEQLLIEDGAVAGSTAGSTAPGRTSSRKRSTPQIAAVEQQMRLSLGTKTEIRQSASGRGKITITFANNDEFERIRSLICPQFEHKAA